MTTTYSGIKKKLMAATSMLLVATIMMMSSTYAWFTLSTAPEVTGISTTVGANGSLEIALSPTDGLATSITSAMGDGNKATVESNVTWGNLVDLSDESYGLGEITLMPAQLNATGDDTSGWTVGTNPLAIPGYGSDGRATELIYTTQLASYTNGAFDGSEYGVQAIGTTSSMSALELAYTNAKANATSAIASAKTAAAAAISGDSGNTLAQLAVDQALDIGSTTVSAAEVEALQSMITNLESSLDYMDTAIRNMIKAEAAATTSMDEETYTAAASTIDELDLSSTSGVSDYLTDDINTAISYYNTLAGDVTTASDALNGLAGDGTDTWTDVKSALANLIDTDAITVNGYGLNDTFGEGNTWTEYDNFESAVINSYLTLSSLTVAMPSGTGVLADIADLAGDYQASVKVDVAYSEALTVNGMTVIMATDSTVSPAYLIAGVNSLSSAPTSGDASTAITDTYGYALDFFFRTNATGSSLLLQTEAAQRIYDDSSNDATQGGGSTMSFTSDTGADVLALMENIRVVFVDASNAVLAYASLDTTYATPIMNEDGLSVDGYEASLYLTDSSYTTFYYDDATITALDQNTAKFVRAIVYLDGETITNADVANAATSMTGTLNLQFSSSEDLVPMDYTALKTGETDT